MSDFYSAIVFLSAFIMIIMVLLVRSNDLVEYSEKQTIYTISVLVIAGAVSEWLAVWCGADLRCGSCMCLCKRIKKGFR